MTVGSSIYDAINQSWVSVANLEILVKPIMSFEVITEPSDTTFIENRALLSTPQKYAR